MLVVKLDVRAGISKPLEESGSNTTLFLKALADKFSLKFIADRLRETIKTHGSGLMISHFTWRFKGQCVVDYLNCYFEFLGPLRENEQDRSDLLSLHLLIITHRIFQKLSSLTNGRSHDIQEIKLAILCGSDVIACFNLLKRHVTYNTFVLCKIIPFSMVHLFESAKICDGGSAGPQRCIGHGTVGSAQGHESVNKFVISIQRFLDRRRGKLWPSLQQMENVVRWVAEFVFPQLFQETQEHGRSQDRYLLNFMKRNLAAQLSKHTATPNPQQERIEQLTICLQHLNDCCQICTFDTPIKKRQHGILETIQIHTMRWEMLEVDTSSWVSAGCLETLQVFSECVTRRQLSPQWHHLKAGVFVTHIANLEYDEVLMRHLEKADDLYNLRKHSVPTAAAFPMDVSVGGPAERAQALSATTVGLTPANPVFQNIQAPHPADQRPCKKLMHRKQGLFV